MKTSGEVEGLQYSLGMYLGIYPSGSTERVAESLWAHFPAFHRKYQAICNTFV
jgi:hypothetical protein